MPFSDFLLILAGILMAGLGGDLFVQLVLKSLRMSPELRKKLETGSISGAGRYIGYLERSIAVILVLAREPGAIAFVVAAKAIMRFESAKDRPFAEYFLIGTFTSILTAVAIGMLVFVLGVQPFR